MTIIKDCMFQYATRHRVLADTDLITFDEAKSLFDKNKHDFMVRLENGEEPEMAIWIDCATSQSYSETSEYWDSDMKIVDGRLYKPV